MDALTCRNFDLFHILCLADTKTHRTKQHPKFLFPRELVLLSKDELTVDDADV